MAGNTLSQVFRSVNTPATNFMRRHLPMINSITSSLSSYFFSISQLKRKKELMSWYKQMPELTSMINKVAMDVTQDFYFENVKPNESGRNKILRANTFAQKVRFRSTMHAQVIDELVTGEGFGWIGKLKEEQIKEAISNVANKYYPDNIEHKENFVNNILSRMKSAEFKATDELSDINDIDGDLLRPRKLRYIPSSTIEVEYDQYDIKDFVQNVGGQRETFSPSEIIHFKLFDIDGKANGFTPVESILVQLELLRQMWQNQLSLHKNGGVPDNIVIAKNMHMSDAAFKRLEQQIEKYKLVENKHGTMIFTGDIDIKELKQMDQMQFKDLGLYVTGVIATLWQIPKSSMAVIIGGTNSQADTGGNSERGYWRCVEFHQKTLAETYNTQFWIPYFGVRLVFDKIFKNQDLQEETSKQLAYGNILTMNNILKTNKKKLGIDKTLKLLDISEQDVEDMSDDELGIPTSAAGVGTSSQPSPSNVGNSLDKVNISAQKKAEQEATHQSKGAKPSGI